MESNGGTTLSLSLFRSLSSLRRVRDEKDAEKSDAAVAACDVYTRIACIHFSPLPLSLFLLLPCFLRLTRSGFASPFPVSRLVQG